jgi:hypothetical protein
VKEEIKVELPKDETDIQLPEETGEITETKTLSPPEIDADTGKQEKWIVKHIIGPLRLSGKKKNKPVQEKPINEQKLKTDPPQEDTSNDIINKF